MDEETMQVEFGLGGWVRVTSTEFNGWLYLRFAGEATNASVTELYYDGRGEEIDGKTLRDLALSRIVATVVRMNGSDDAGWPTHMSRSLAYPGPNLSLLASYFHTSFGPGAKHWVADSFRAQVDGSQVVNPGPGRAPDSWLPSPARNASKPPPLQRPGGGRLTDEFLRELASNYAYAVGQGRRPAPEIARMTGVNVRTVHGWVSKARARGFMPPGRQGRVG